MKPTVVGLVTPHLLRVVDLANEAQKGVNVDWHLRDTVDRAMRDLGDLYNASTLTAAYIEGLEIAASQVVGSRPAYLGVLKSAAETARKMVRE